MRKDAKIGFAIGGVLLAVLIVYIIVVPSHKKTAQAPAGATLAVSTPAPAAEQPTTEPSAPSAVATGTTDTVAKNDGVNWDKLLGNSSNDAPPLMTSTPQAGAQQNSSPAPAAAVHNPDPVDNTAASSVTATPFTATPTMASAPATQPGAALASHSYTIKSGQTLSSIASEVYGNARFYVAIKRANPSIDPNRLRPGTSIVLPDISDVKPDVMVASRQSSLQSGSLTSHEVDSSGRTYTVASGDTLYRIAKKLYGSPKKADAIYDLNKQNIGSDPAKLKLGTVLQLPEAATVSVSAANR